MAEQDMDEYYRKRREELSKIRSSSIDSYDKTILQLSTGALAITIAFLEKIGKPYSDITNLLINASWIGFLLIIIINLLGFYFAVKNMDFKINDLDERYKKHLNDDSWPEEKFSCYKKVTEFCNRATLWLFFCAATLFVIYAIMVQNYSYTQSSSNKSMQEVTMSHEKNNSKVNERAQIETTEPRPIKKGIKDTAEKALTETTEPIRKPSDKPKK